jgi:hypothetical protein
MDKSNWKAQNEQPKRPEDLRLYRAELDKVPAWITLPGKTAPGGAGKETIQISGRNRVELSGRVCSKGARNGR